MRLFCAELVGPIAETIFVGWVFVEETFGIEDGVVAHGILDPDDVGLAFFVCVFKQIMSHVASVGDELLIVSLGEEEDIADLEEEADMAQLLAQFPYSESHVA